MKLPKTLNILPLPLNKKTPPLLKKWQNTRYPREKLKGHKGNYALGTGDISGKLIAFDWDFRKGFNRKEKGFKIIFKEYEKALPDLANTLIVETPNGYHFYYFYDGFEPRNTSATNCGFDKKGFINSNETRYPQFLAGLDTRGNGGYVVMPPSVVEGKKYKWHTKVNPKKITKEEYDKIFDFFLLNLEDDKIKQQNIIRKGFVDILEGNVNPNTIKSQETPEHVYWKEMYHECYSVGGLLPEDLFEGLERFQKGFDLEKTKLQLENEQNKQYIFDGKRLSKKKYDKYFPEHQIISSFFDDEEEDLHIIYERETNCKAQYKRDGELYDKREYRTWIETRLKNRYNDLGYITDIEDTYEITLEFLKRNLIKAPDEYRTPNSFSILYYEDGVWNERTRAFLNKRLHEFCKIPLVVPVDIDHPHKDPKEGQEPLINFLDYKTHNRFIKTIHEHIKNICYCSIKEFNIREMCIPVRNGVINYSNHKNIKLESHSPENQFTYQLNVNYDAEETELLIKKHIYNMLRSELKKDDDVELELDILFMSFGDALMGQPYKYQKMLILLGESESGKSTLLEAFQDLIGDQHVVSYSLQEIQESDYVKAELEHALLNVYSDLPIKRINDTDRIKICVDKTITGNKKFGSHRKFRNTTKHIFAANKLPKIFEEQRAFHRRFNIITCKKNWSKKDPLLLEKLTSNKEKSGLLNLALQGLTLLIENEGYPDQDVSNIWDQSSRPLECFMEQYTKRWEKDHGAYTQHTVFLDELLDHLNEFLEGVGAEPIKSTSWLGRKLQRLYPRWYTTVPDRDTRKRVLQGCEIMNHQSKS